MIATTMEAGVGDSINAAAAAAAYQAAIHTDLIHLAIGLFTYSESCRTFLDSNGVPKIAFEKWHSKIKENMLTLEECTPEPSPEFKDFLIQYIQHDQPAGLLTEKSLILQLLQSPNVKVQKYLKALKINQAEFVKFLSTEEQVEAEGDGTASSKAPFSDFVEDLNIKAKSGEITHIQGRQQDLQWLINTLCQFRKKNAILIGNPGVGKTALIEELALQIVEGTVPSHLKDKVIYSLDVGAMVAGTKLRGQFEERMNNLVKFLRQKKNIILFIDEIHTIMGAGNARGSNLNAANMLKPALSRGEISCIGATTPDDVQPLEKDPAFKRRFKFKWLDQLTDEETLTVLKAESQRLGAHYNITYTLGSLKRILEAANDYYPHQFNPDKALTLADSVGSYTKFELHQGVVNTKNVNLSLKAKNLKEYHCIINDIEKQANLMFGASSSTRNLCMAIQSYLMQLQQPAVLLLHSDEAWVTSELTKFIAKQVHDMPPLWIEGNNLQGGESITQLKGVPAGYPKEPTLLEELHYSPHRTVCFNNLDQADPGFQLHMLRALETGELVENSGKKLSLKHTLFIVTLAQPKRGGYLAEAPTKCQPPKGMPTHTTEIQVPKPRPAWVESYLFAKLCQLSDRVRTKIKVAYNADMPKFIRQEMEKHGERYALKLVEAQILHASQQQQKRLVITPELIKTSEIIPG